MALVGPWSLVATLVYPLQIARGALLDRADYGGPLGRRVRMYALLLRGKFAEAQGAVEFEIKRLRGTRMGAILDK